MGRTAPDPNLLQISVSIFRHRYPPYQSASIRSGQNPFTNGTAVIPDYLGCGLVCSSSVGQGEEPVDGFMRKPLVSLLVAIQFFLKDNSIRSKAGGVKEALAHSDFFMPQSGVTKIDLKGTLPPGQRSLLKGPMIILGLTTDMAPETKAKELLVAG